MKKEHKFKKGDYVKCLNASGAGSGRLHIGGIYLVSDTSSQYGKDYVSVLSMEGEEIDGEEFWATRFEIHRMPDNIQEMIEEIK